MLHTVASDLCRTGTHVCSMFARMSRHGPVAAGTKRHWTLSDAVQPGRSWHVRHQPTPPSWQSSRLLICGFGVRVPGGARILTWGFIMSRSPCEGRFWPVVAPRLLVSPDLVARASDPARGSPYRWCYTA